MTTIAQLAAFGRSHHACRNGLDWLATLDQSAPAHSAWETCTEPRWLLWLAPRAGVTGNVYAAIACDVVEQIALPRAGQTVEVVKATISTTRRYIKGEATKGELAPAINAARAAWLAAFYADGDAGPVNAADDACYAAISVAVVADTPRLAADDAVRFAARAADANACGIIRNHIPWAQIEPAIAKETP